MKNTRRRFLFNALLGGVAIAAGVRPSSATKARQVMTVHGSIKAEQMGKTLVHEHLLVDFIGAKDTGYHRWDRDEVIKRVLPYLQSLRASGYKTLVDCTPAYLGRDPYLLKTLSERSELQVITNTGYYGARQNQFLPDHAFEEDPGQLAERWLNEWEKGIDGSGVRPGFMKIGIDEGRLSSMHEKLVRAAARVHLESGLTIASHTGTATGAFHELEILRDESVSPTAFIWVHAQSEKDLSKHVEAARQGAWVSLDGVSKDQIDAYVTMLKNLKEHDLLNRALISHDAGWYSPGEPNGGDFRDFGDIESSLLPALASTGFSKADVDQLLIRNPSDAFGISVRKRKR